MCLLQSQMVLLVLVGLDEGSCNMGELIDKRSIKITEPHEGLHVFDCFWDGSICNPFDFDRVHTCYPLLKD